MLLQVLLASLLVMLVSLAGKLLTVCGAGTYIERNLHYFVSFAAGVLLIVAWSLSQEIIEHAGSLSQGLPWIAVGAVVVLIAFQYIPHFHHHHETGDHQHSRIDANRILASDAIHNIGDGIVIVISFAASPVLGIASTISIAVHEILQEISEFFVLREAGLSVGRALTSNFIASSTILIGTFGAFFLLGQFEPLEVPLLGLSVGSYLVVVFHDLIPHSISRSSERAHVVQHIVYFLVGAALMAMLIAYLPHAEV
ncbi:ZIP family metal transporter [Candidatus Kaiserbacteria bacterium]|nr:ZIP family metal transporter [Candidatus Kaiserbacteria bacterium]